MREDIPQTAENVTEPYPGDVYGTPENLVAANLPHEQKVRLMQQWAADLKARLRASDENMSGTAPNQTGDLLQRIKNAQRVLEGGR